jgi:hypothetical protein
LTGKCYPYDTIIIDADALYALKGGGFGEEVGVNEGLTFAAPVHTPEGNFKHQDNLNTSLLH